MYFLQNIYYFVSGRRAEKMSSVINIKLNSKAEYGQSYII
jgi:hypothetical protein